MMGTLLHGSGASTLGLVLLTVTMSSSCMFDCHDTSTSACGGGNVDVDAIATIFQASGWPPPLTVDGIPQFTQGYLKAVNLSNRGITSIAIAGLECYNFSPVGCLYEETVAGSSLIQAILLDGNELTAIPNMSVFTNTCYVSLTNNMIGGTLPSNMFRGFVGGDSLSLDLQGNSINGTSTATFAGYGVSMLAVNVQGNKFNSNALADGTFSELYGDYVAVNFQLCNISGTMTSEMFAGRGPTQMHVQLQNNSIAALSGNVFNGFSNQFLCVN
jgi:hypothetical protein